jgi:hypothetical protein
MLLLVQQLAKSAGSAISCFCWPVRLCYHYYMATAKQSQRRTNTASRSPARKAPDTKNKSLPNLYARLEKTRPGSEDSKRISRQIVDSIG